MNVPNAWAEGYDGSGYAVAVLDIGVQGGHNFFGGRVIAEYCSSTYDNQYYAPAYVLKSLCPGGIYTQEQFGLGASNPTACMDLAAGYLTNGIPGEYCDHGTHVAGIAAGNNGATAPGEGVAKGANIIGVQVFTYIQCSSVEVYCSGDGIGAFDSNIIAGLQHVYDLRTTYPIASVNMSLGGSKYNSQSACDSRNPGMKAIIDQLRAANIATLIATGNDYYGDGIGYPGCISSVPISLGRFRHSPIPISWLTCLRLDMGLTHLSPIRSTVLRTKVVLRWQRRRWLARGLWYEAHCLTLP
jgi:subtilisin family serine protease